MSVRASPRLAASWPQAQVSPTRRLVPGEGDARELADPVGLRDRYLEHGSRPIGALQAGEVDRSRQPSELEPRAALATDGLDLGALRCLDRDQAQQRSSVEQATGEPHRR